MENKTIINRLLQLHEQLESEDFYTDKTRNQLIDLIYGLLNELHIGSEDHREVRANMLETLKNYI